MIQQVVSFGIRYLLADDKYYYLEEKYGKVIFRHMA